MYKYQISFAFEYNGIRQARIVVLMFQDRLEAAEFAQKQCDRMNEYGKNITKCTFILDDCVEGGEK